MRKELKLVLFYIIYLIGVYVVDKLAPSGPCTPGPGFLLFMLFIPISIILFLKDIFKYIKNPERSRLYCIIIHPTVWAILFILLKLND